MKEKHSSQMQAVKKKLMAATSMLLVAAIMLVSSTYAWFTLSTAPEVTGITTTVGANGSLEIALADATTWSDPDTLVSSAAGDSQTTNKDGVKGANITWGNLVDLSDDSYGLKEVVLYPAALNISKDAGTGVETIQSQPLSIPKYGSDGRVTELVSSTLTGAYDSTSSTFVSAFTSTDDEGTETTTAPYGVRVIGSSAGMTDRQIAYRSASSTFYSKITSARSAASVSLQDNGAELAEIIINYAADSSADENTEVANSDQKAALDAMLSDLSTSLDNIDAAFNQAVLAQIASAAGQDAGISDETFTLASAVLKGTFKVSENVTDGKLTIVDDSGATIASVTLDSELAAAVALYTTARTNLDSAMKASEDLGNEENAKYTWGQIKDVINYLVESEKVLVNEWTVTEIRADKSGFASKVYNEGIIVEMPTGSGIFADISDMCGKYMASIVIPTVSAMGMSLTNVDATMATKIVNGTGENRAYLVYVYNNSLGGAPEGGSTENGAAEKITDTYGYLLDFYFRTNASSSNLLLQTEEAQRIYSDASNTETLGGGSYMEFTATDVENFKSNSMTALMDCIRIIFLDGDANVISYAKLDTKGSTAGESGGIKAPIVLCDKVETTVDEVTTVSYVAKTGEDASVITALTQNKAQKVSVLVYLDGEQITNADVSTAATSMTGKMNLQFASDAELQPMDNTALKQGE